jgi:hypothetical protein
MSLCDDTQWKVNGRENIASVGLTIFGYDWKEFGWMILYGESPVVYPTSNRVAAI